MSFIAGFGKTNIDLFYQDMPRVPGEGEEVYAPGFSIQLGGGVPATLIHLARLGVPVKLATAWGEDMFSAFAVQEFSHNGITPLNLYTPGSFPVNVTSVAITERDRTFFSYGPEQALTGQQQSQLYQMARGAGVVLMQKGSLEVYRRLKAEGAVMVFDTGWDDSMTLESYRPYLELADYYMPNVREALKITGANTPEEAAMVLNQLFHHVIVKLDKAGCLGMENGTVFKVDHIDAFRHVDSTGAGDAFLAGFLYGLYHHKSFKECILYGNLTGGKCITGVGCLTNHLTEPELLRLAAEYQFLIA